MKITRIRVTNYRGIAELDAAIPAAGVIAKGRNGAGKTSVLRAIRAALAARDVGPDAIRLGADRAEIFIDLDDVTVKRVITAKGSPNVSIETAAGDVKKKPQTWLTQMLGTSALDPLDFYLADKKRRIELVVAAMPTKLTKEQFNEWDAGAVRMGVDVKLIEQLPGLAACELVTKAYYDKRTAVNATIKETSATLEVRTSALEKRKAALYLAAENAALPELAAAEAAVVAARDVVAELTARGKRVMSQDEKFAKTRTRVAEIDEGIGEDQAWLQSTGLPTRQAIEDGERAIAAKRETIRRHEEELAAMVARQRESEESHDEATSRRHRINGLIKERDGLVEAMAQGTEIAPTPEEISTALGAQREAELARDQSADAVAIAKAKTDLAAEAKELLEAEKFATELTARVEFWRTEAPRRLLAEAKGIDGLTIDGDSVLLDGKVVDALSGREQMRLAVEIARRANAKTKILVVDGLERLDPEQLEAFVADATRDGWQLIGTRVDRGDIVLEAVEIEEAEAGAVSLLFRERAAIALYSRADSLGEASAVDLAQDLADVFCAKQGHDWAPMTHYGMWRPPASAMKEDEARCRRCGIPEKDNVGMTPQDMRDLLALAAGVMTGGWSALKNVDPNVGGRLLEVAEGIMRRLQARAPEEPKR